MQQISMKWTARLAISLVGLAWTGTLLAQGAGHSMLRHRHVMQTGLPAAYATARNPLPADPRTISAGAAVFAENCTLCHGAKGLGDGDGGEDLDPPPANLAQMVAMPMASDAFLFWSIVEGGEPIGTDMPPFKDVLTAEMIWQVIAFLRTNLAASPAGPRGPMGPAMGRGMRGGMGHGPRPDG